MASDVYANAKYLMATDSLGWVNASNTFRAMLVSDSYSYSHAQTYVADVIASEVSGGNYDRIDVVNRTASLDLAGDRALLDADDLLWSGLTGVIASGVVIYRRIGVDDSTPSDDPLLCFIDIPTTAADGTNFLVELDVDGAVALTVC